jgi:hypothetical protein
MGVARNECGPPGRILRSIPVARRLNMPPTKPVLDSGVRGVEAFGWVSEEPAGGWWWEVPGVDLGASVDEPLS